MAEMADISKDLAFITGKRAAMTAQLEAWCAINSGSRNLAGLARMRAALADAFSVLGEVETVPAGAQESVDARGEPVRHEIAPLLRVVRRPQAPVRVLLAGHMDTVFAADHPFQSGRFLDADTLNAPGAADMKGGILVMLAALECLEHSPYADKIGYEVLLNADEEIGSFGSTPVLYEAGKRAHFAMVYEPAMPSGDLAGARKGSGNFSAVFEGRAAHAGRDHAAGRNAVVAAAEAALMLDALSGARAGLTVNVARIDGGGPNNIVPDRAVVRFNARCETAADAAFFEARAREILAGAREGVSAHLHGSFNRPPKPMTPQLEAFFRALRACGVELGLDIGWKATGGVCDGNNIAAAGIPVIDTLGVRGGDIHSDTEFARLDSLEERARLSALLLMRIARGDLPNPGAAPAGVLQ
jgi:glutamate carboxypeptidase